MICLKRKQFLKFFASSQVTAILNAIIFPWDHTCRYELRRASFKSLALNMDEWELFMQHVSEGHLIFSELTHNSWEITLHSKLTSNILECYQEKI